LGAIPHDTSGASFIDKHVFPNGDLLPLSAMLAAAENVGLEVRDVENLREHYRLTLRHWVRRLEENREEILWHVSDRIYRTWQLYMAGSAYGFGVGQLAIHQTLLTKIGSEGGVKIPLTRNKWYQRANSDASSPPSAP
jgi:cyclopropane-fatty-acyl-phospholipid synthase